MNRKGINGLGVALIIFMIFVSLGGSFLGYRYWQTTQTALELKTPEERAVQEGIATSLVSVKARTIDKETNNAQVSTTLYAWLKSEPTKQLSNGQTTSATAGTDTTISNVVVGDTLVLAGFDNATYYPDPTFTEEVIEREGELIEVPVHAITTSLEMKIYDAGSETDISSSAGAVNLSLGASETDDIDWFQVKVNSAQKSFYLDSVVFDVPANSNIANIQMEGITESTEKINFMKDTADYRFKLAEPVFLREYQKWRSPSVVVTASGTDVTTEDVGVYFMDKQAYSSVNKQPGAILWGVENDADTELDIGMHYKSADVQFGVN